MNKQEFLTILKQSLDGEIPDYEVENNIHYYETYLVDEQNKTLDEKLRELGEPRLIARTIIDAYLASKEGSFRKSTYSNYDYEEDYNEAKKEKSSQGNVKYYTWDTMKWYQKIIFIIIGVIIAVVFVGLFTLGINIFFRILLPVLLIMFVIKKIAKLFL